ncbi:hypothetical protein CJ195_14930 [Bacillus sp. UMB0899]|uniref:hypothetical protein n=1 Tax=Metabacillus schmidteae TaxID=2730405 RepID=UPI000C80AB28|nr:hypothetical protein [Metabacillus schmidteae]PMC36720.1 hypothetical protein CJ195_14930 [Bacillus sp. UMB0899]
MEQSYEYSQSLKVLTKMTPVKLSEICDLLKEIIEIFQHHNSKEEKHIIEIKNNISDLYNLLEQSMLLLNDVIIEKQLLIDLVVSIIEFLCNIMKELEILQGKLDFIPISHQLKMKYRLVYLHMIIKEIIA